MFFSNSSSTCVAFILYNLFKPSNVIRTIDLFIQKEGQGESHGWGGMAEESKGEAHHVELSNMRMQGDKKDMDREEGSQDNFYADQDCKDEEVAQTRKSG